jgi:hypothetical protein
MGFRGLKWYWEGPNLFNQVFKFFQHHKLFKVCYLNRYGA